MKKEAKIEQIFDETLQAFDKKVYEVRKRIREEDDPSTLTTVNLDLEDEVYDSLKNQSEVMDISIEDYILEIMHNGILNLKNQENDLEVIDTAQLEVYTEKYVLSNTDYLVLDTKTLEENVVLLANKESLEFYEKNCGSPTEKKDN